MGCGNMYDWMVQSKNHAAVARQKYPTAFLAASSSPNYGAFIGITQRLPAVKRHAYNREFVAWWKEYGYNWDRMGCIGEGSPGDLARQFSFPNQEHHIATRPRSLRGTTMSGFRGAFGQTSTKPKLEPGYSWCNSIPPSFPITEMRPVPGDVNGWYYRIWAGDADGKNYYEYKQYATWDWASEGTGANLWACPSVTASAGSTANLVEVKSIQSALFDRGYNPGKIDGKWGPGTCGAAYSFKKNELAEYGATLGPSFFAFLGLGGNGYDQKYAQACASWFTGDLGPEPEAVPNAPVKDVQKALVDVGYDVGKIDGKWGPKTCGAAYAHMREWLGDYGEVLTGDFYNSLMLKGSGYNTSCKAYYVPMEPPPDPPLTPITPIPDEEPEIIPPPTPTPPKPTPTKPKPVPTKPKPTPPPPTPIPPKPEPIPEPDKAGIPWWLGAIVVGGLIIGGLTIGPKKGKKGKKRRKRRKKR